MTRNYTMVLTTYFRRFDEWLKPIVIEIKKQRPDIELIVMINGEQDEDFHEDYRKEVLDFLKEFPNTFPVMFPKFRSLAQIWNTGVRMSSYENTLISSEDITLKDGFFDAYEKNLSHSLQQNAKSFVHNGSYSCFSLNKLEVIETGWFDERLLGLGHEDGEYCERYCKLKGLGSFPTYTVPECDNTLENKKLADFIYSEIRLGGQELCSQFNRYSRFNEIIKPHVSATANMEKQYPYETYYLENKHNL
jgi:hypothetical protein